MSERLAALTEQCNSHTVKQLRDTMSGKPELSKECLVRMEPAFHIVCSWVACNSELMSLPALQHVFQIISVLCRLLQQSGCEDVVQWIKMYDALGVVGKCQRAYEAEAPGDKGGRSDVGVMELPNALMHVKDILDNKSVHGVMTKSQSIENWILFTSVQAGPPTFEDCHCGCACSRCQQS